jgi:hypothetical protein
MLEQDTSMPHLDENGHIVHGTNAVTIDPATYIHISREQLRANLPQSVKDRQELIRLRRSLVYANVAAALNLSHAPHARRLAELTSLNGGPILPAEDIRARIRELEARVKQ